MGSFTFFLLVKDYLVCLLICPSSRITYIEMHKARDVNNQRCDRSQTVAANSKIVLYFQFWAATKLIPIKGVASARML